MIVIALLLALADPQPQVQPKNLKVLKDLPPAQLLPVMVFMSNSLGVTCMHCHTDNLSGKYQLETGMLGSIYSTNLTSGGGRTRSIADWALAVRHGLDFKK